MSNELIAQQKGTLVGDVITPPRELSTQELGAIAAEAFDPASTPDKVIVGGREVPVTFVYLKTERRILGIIAPYLSLLLDAATLGTFEQILQGVLAEAQHDVTMLACIILEARWKDEPEFQPKDATFDAAGVQLTPERTTRSLIEEWLDENARFEEIVALVRAQIQKNKLGDCLGKLWSPAALAGRTLKALSSLQSLSTQATPSSSTGSMLATASTPST